MKKATALCLALCLLCLTACSLDFLNRDGGGKEPPVQAVEPEIPAVSGGEEDPAQPEEPEQPGENPEEEPEDPAEQPEEPEERPEEPEAVSMSHQDVTLFSPGETFPWRVKGAPEGYTCAFASDRPETAAVDGEGVVTAVAPGTATLTAEVACEGGPYRFQCIVRCRWEPEESGLPEDGGGGETPALADFLSTLQGRYEGLSALSKLDGELLDNYYPGLSAVASVEEVLVQETAMTTANVAVGLVRLSPDAPMEDVLAVQAAFQSRVTAQAEGGAWYPASCETWANGVITSASNCVGLFVYPEDAQSMANLFTETYGK